MKLMKKDIITEANNVGQLQGDVSLVRDPQVIHKRLQDKNQCIL